MRYYAVDFSLTIEGSFRHRGRFGISLDQPDPHTAEKQARTQAAHEARELYPLARQIEVMVLRVAEISADEYAASALA